MFSTNHFIWLGLCAVCIGASLFLAVRYKLSFKIATFTVCGVSLASELCKIFTHIEPVMNSDGDVVGGVLDAGALPFHLCSILIFIFFYMGFCKNEQRLEKLKSFVTPIAVLGGTMALLIPTSGVDFLKPYAYQCFVYHAAIIWYALYLIITKRVKLDFSSYKRNMLYLFTLLFVMIWVNSILQVYNTNFFYVVRPPMENLPILNLDNGWFVYLISLIGVAFVLFTLFHLPFILKERKSGRNENK